MVSVSKPSISRRKYIKWGPSFPVENTTTIVLSSPSRRFVDVRLHMTNANLLDWAFAGTSSTSPVGNGNETYHAVFHHWVDSHHADAEAVVDEGDMRPGASGATLETGTMRNPSTGRVEDYEECWADLSDDDATFGDGRGWVLRRTGAGDADVERGMMARVGTLVQGVLRTGAGGVEDGDVAVGRWEFAGHRAVGLVGGPPENVESRFYLGDWDALVIGDEVHSGDGGRWVCIERW